jgi:hypothetical protein
MGDIKNTSGRHCRMAARPVFADPKSPSRSLNGATTGEVVTSFVETGQTLERASPGYASTYARTSATICEVPPDPL